MVAGDVGKIITCDVTVAEPDGSNAEVRTATYAEVIEVAGTIDKPTVLAPQDGAGSGNARYLKSDTIIEVEGGGIDTCETDLIESVLMIKLDIFFWSNTAEVTFDLSDMNAPKYVSGNTSTRTTLGANVAIGTKDGGTYSALLIQLQRSRDQLT